MGSGLPPTAASMGMRVMATASEVSKAQLTVKARSLNSWPATPRTKIRGTNTHTVVKVDAVMACPTSIVPCNAARHRSMPAARWRSILSSTTMALSTSIPMPRAKPPSDKMLSEISKKYMSRKLPTTDTGMVLPMMSVLRTSWRNKYSTSMASKPPSQAVLSTCRMA